MHQFGKYEFVSTIAGVALLLGATACTGKKLSSDEINKRDAKCNSLNVYVLNAAKHIVKIETDAIVTGGAKIAGITYVFGTDLPSVTTTSPNTIETYTFPPTPLDQKREITAVVDYTLNGKIYGGINTCTQEVTFKPEPSPDALSPTQ